MTATRRPDRSPQAKWRDLSLLAIQQPARAPTVELRANKRSLDKLGMTFTRRPDRSPQAEWRDLLFQRTQGSKSETESRGDKRSLDKLGMTGGWLGMTMGFVQQDGGA